MLPLARSVGLFSATRSSARGPIESHIYPRKSAGVFADLGVLADRDPEEARKILDPDGE
jgi:hypothetical protein